MILLDTDVLSHLQKQDVVGAVIASNLAASPDQDIRITTVNAYEMLGGALDLLHDMKKRRKKVVPGFQLFQELLEYLGTWQRKILPYDDKADNVYQGFTSRLRQELKNDAQIAAIALAHSAAVWTCNEDDYKRVPGLSVYAAKTGMRVV
jgi:predicted nucleic acid-binding protein